MQMRHMFFTMKIKRNCQIKTFQSAVNEVVFKISPNATPAVQQSGVPTQWGDKKLQTARKQYQAFCDKPENTPELEKQTAQPARKKKKVAIS